ncbi:MAG: peptidoglycan-binding protein [Nitrospirota bacterium]
MKDNFEKSVEFVLTAEGGYVNSDPGGETNYGISKRAYPWLDIKNLGFAEAKEIYFNDYWLLAGCDKLQWPMCLVQLDTAVNMGVGQANKMLKQLSGLSQSQGVAAYLTMRKKYYESIAGSGRNAHFVNGWLNRLRRLSNYIESH